MSKKAKAAPKAPKLAPKVKVAKAAKPKIGRPSLYKPEYCKRIVELGKQGKTKSQMAAALDIALPTFNAWLDAHEKFADSYARADTQARAFMEGLAERGVFLGARFNDRAWLAMLRSRWPEFNVAHAIRTANANVPVKEVTASRGKSVRADPVAQLYEQGRVEHVAGLGELEDQCLNMSPAGYHGERSPDRVDALVWGLSELSQTSSGGFSIIGVMGDGYFWEFEPAAQPWKSHLACLSRMAFLGRVR